jgi:hypothetical protein
MTQYLKLIWQKFPPPRTLNNQFRISHSTINFDPPQNSRGVPNVPTTGAIFTVTGVLWKL